MIECFAFGQTDTSISILMSRPCQFTIPHDIWISNTSSQGIVDISFELAWIEENNGGISPSNSILRFTIMMKDMSIWQFWLFNGLRSKHSNVGTPILQAAETKSKKVHDFIVRDDVYDIVQLVGNRNAAADKDIFLVHKMKKADGRRKQNTFDFQEVYEAVRDVEIATSTISVDDSEKTRDISSVLSAIGEVLRHNDRSELVSKAM
jgi:hypothetical protein